MKPIDKEYLKLIRKYRELIDIIYDIVPSSNYTPDYMTYDYRGYYEYYQNDNYDHKKELKQAVNKANLFVKYLTHPYEEIFG
jgi:hypothetical protein